MNGLYISDYQKSGLLQVAGLVVYLLQNRGKRELKKVFLRLIRAIKQVEIVLEKAFLRLKTEDIRNDYFLEYPSGKAKKANSLYVITRKK